MCVCVCVCVNMRVYLLAPPCSFSLISPVAEQINSIIILPIKWGAVAVGKLTLHTQIHTHTHIYINVARGTKVKSKDQ